MQALVMLKSMGVFQFSGSESEFVSATVSYSGVSKYFFYTTSNFLVVLSPSDLLTHTRKLNKSDLFNLHQFVSALRSWI